MSDRSFASPNRPSFTIEDRNNSIAFVQQALTGFGRQIPFAMMRTINSTADDIKVGLVKEMKTVFDRPKPWTLNAIRVQYAKKADLQSTIWLKDPEVKGLSGKLENHLTPHVYGGQRQYKPFERALFSNRILPKGMDVVPGAGATLDAYGNMTSGFIYQMLNYFNARRNPEFGVGYNFGTTSDKKIKMKKGTKKKYGVEYFINHGYRTYMRSSTSKQETRSTVPGIWMRVHTPFGTAIKPVMLFVKKSHYQPRFDFFGVAQQIADKVMLQNAQKAVHQALSTMK